MDVSTLHVFKFNISLYDLIIVHFNHCFISFIIVNLFM
jgi:hypothetical protein